MLIYILAVIYFLHLSFLPEYSKRTPLPPLLFNPFFRSFLSRYAPSLPVHFCVLLPFTHSPYSCSIFSASFSSSSSCNHSPSIIIAYHFLILVQASPHDPSFTLTFYHLRPSTLPQFLSPSHRLIVPLFHPCLHFITRMAALLLPSHPPFNIAIS